MQADSVFRFQATLDQGGDQMNLAWLPPTAAGLSLDDGYILSGIVLDPELFHPIVQRPKEYWSVTCGAA